MKEFIPLFKNKKFLHLWNSQILSQLAIHIMNFVLLIRIFQETGSPIAISFLWIAYSLPAFLFGPIGAASADVADKKNILMLTNFLQSLVIFIYAFISNGSPYRLYALVLSYSLLNQFYVPAELSTLPSVVKEEFLASANSLFLVTHQAALVVGVGIAGQLAKLLGFERTLLICSGLLFLAFLSVSTLPKISPKEIIKEKFSLAVEKFFERIIKGYQFIKSERYVLAPLLLLIFMQVTLAIIVVNIPVLAANLFSISVDTAGVFLVIPAGIGALSSSFFVPKFLRRGVRKKEIIEKSLFILTLASALMTFLVPELSGLLKSVLSVFLLVLLGFSFIGVTIPSQTLLQEKTPENLRGRVFGNYWYLVTVVTIFPILVSGVLTEILGIRIFLFILTSAFLAVLITINTKGEKVILFTSTK